ncbi:MAG: T9SS type A sorting domain-containing protein [Paludibacteraceae bacterium]
MKGDTITWVDGENTYKSTYRWQYFGVPVTYVEANPTFYGSWVREYIESLNGDFMYQKWRQLDNSCVLSPFKGYEITQNNPKVVTYQGNLVVGDQELMLSVSGSTGFYGAGYNIFGNSFTAAIDVSKIKFPESGVQKTVYIYNTGTFSEWAMQNGQAGTYIAIPQQTASVTGSEIPSMQGFLLIASENNSKITLPYNAIDNSLTKNTVAQRINKDHTSNANNLSYLKIEVKSNSMYDTAWLFEKENTSHLFDNGWDGYKLLGTEGMGLYFDEEIGKLQVNTLNNIDSTYISFKAGSETQYTMTFDSENLLNKYQNLYVIDLVEKKSIKLNSNIVTYHFFANNNISAEKRFLIKGVQKESKKHPNFRIIQKQGLLDVQNEGMENGVLYIYDTVGRTIATMACLSESTTSVPCNLERGAYILKIITEKGQRQVQKIIVQ